MKTTHLRNLMQDKERCFALTAEHEGILLDYSRQSVLPETMVSSILFLFVKFIASITSITGHAV